MQWRGMRRLNGVVAILAMASVSGAASPDVALKAPQSVARFDVAEFILSVASPHVGNPFRDVEILGEFWTEGGGHSHAAGFADSQDGSVFQIRFCPDRAGARYKYVLTFRGSGIDRRFEGSFRCEVSQRPGPVVVDHKHPKHFSFAGTRTPFYHLGYTAYHLLDPSNDDRQVDATIDYCAREGFNKIRFLLTGYPKDSDHRANRDVGPGVADTDKRPNYGALPGRVNPLPAWLGEPHHYDFRRFNVAHWQRIDRAVQRMRDRGIVATCILTIEKQNLPAEYGRLTDAELRLYRYAVARLAAFDNVWWDLGNEHNEYRDVKWGNAMGSLVAAIDPFNRLISAHAYADFLYPKSDWAGFIITQQHGEPQETHDWVLKYRAIPKPYINEEYGYEGKLPRPGHDQDADHVRRDHWSIAMAGGYATYGDQSDGTACFYMGVPGPGIAARQLKHLRRFFEAIPYQRFDVHDECTPHGFCLGRPPDEYVFYFPRGGEVRVNLGSVQSNSGASGGSGGFSARWFDPRKGTWLDAPGLRPGENIVTAPEPNDWVLYVRATGASSRPADHGDSGGDLSARKSPNAVVRRAPRYSFGIRKPENQPEGYVDCNSPAHWDGDVLYMFFSNDVPYRSFGPDLMQLDPHPRLTRFDNQLKGGRWIEATWKEPGGKLYGWYHHEPRPVCPNKPDLSAPLIGAVVSDDNGMNWQDLGIVLRAPGDSLFCETPNKFFAGGNGDFSVIADRQGAFFYFFISTYNRDKAEQGVAVARMSVADRSAPVGKVFKWYNSRWGEPGLGGRVTPVFPGDWHRTDATAFWGPSLHFNTYLQQFAVLLNHARDAAWEQEGIYISFNPDVSDPARWTQPVKILKADRLEKSKWYPQVVGTSAAMHETDKLAGRTARLFVAGLSKWEIVFLKPGEEPPDAVPATSAPVAR